MIISEKNCEEYFLLYADNELTAAERKAVETFTEQYPKYAAALKTLLQTKLSDDENFTFNNKEALYRNADAEIGVNNYEDYFLLYTDNELSEEDKQNTERFVLQHPQLQTEFTLLQQSKLSPETINHPNKKELYKKERRIIFLSFNRMLGAAAVLVAIAIGWLLPVAKQNDNKQVTTISKINSHQQKNSTPVTTETTSLHVEKKELVKSVKPQQTVNEQTSIVKKKEVIQDKKEVEILLPEITETQTQPQLQTAFEHTQTEPDHTMQTTVLKPLEEVNDDENAETALSLSNDNTTAKPAVYKELNTDEDTHTLYVGSLQLNRVKVNGFFKSASHLFGSKIKQNAD